MLPYKKVKGDIELSNYNSFDIIED